MARNLLTPENLMKGFVKRVAHDLGQVAKEDIEVEAIGDTVYVFGSELATLRMFMYYNRYHRNEKTRQDFSLPRNSHYFSLDTDF